jgi:hypothetical protein
MSNFLLFVVKLLGVFLNSVKRHDDCPDGICDAPLALADKLETGLRAPSLSFGVLDIFSFMRCFPMKRVVEVGKRIVALIQGCDKCPDGGCSFMDILSCINLEEAVSIVKEILDIIRDSQVCVDDEGFEITLGQANG